MNPGFDDQTHYYRFHIAGKTSSDGSTTPYETPETALTTYERLVIEHGVDRVRIEKETRTPGFISPDQLRRELSKG